MDRKEILSSPEYWLAKSQIELYNCAETFMTEQNLNRVQLANHLGVSKSYVSQLLNGDYDHRLSKFIQLALAFGYVPKIEFIPIEQVLSSDSHTYNLPKQVSPKYSIGYTVALRGVELEDNFEKSSSKGKIQAA